MINFFISRPVFSWVLAIVAMLAGIMAIFVLPVQRYPSVAPPAVEFRPIILVPRRTPCPIRWFRSLNKR